MAVLRPHLALTVTDVERVDPVLRGALRHRAGEAQARLREVLGRRAGAQLHAHQGERAELGAFNHAGIQVASPRTCSPRRSAWSRPVSPHSTRWTRPAATRARTRSGCATQTARRGRCSRRTRTSRSRDGGARRRRGRLLRLRRRLECCSASRSAALRVSDEIQLNDPQTLYRRWEDSQWSPFADRPREGPRAVAADGDERSRPVYFVLSSLMVAEERITTKFSGLVGAYGSEEEATFLSTQQVDEARHMQFYARFQDEVVAEPATVAAHVERAREQVSDAFRAIFDVALVEAHEKLVAHPGDLGAKVALRHALPPDPRGDARADDVQVRHRLPRRAKGCCPASSRATRRSTTTRRATSATASGSCARR